MERRVHHRQGQQGEAGRPLLAHQVRPEGAGDAGGEAGRLAEGQARVVVHAGALEGAHGLVVAEAQVVEAHAIDRPGLGAQGGQLGRQRGGVVGRGERAVQPHLAARGPHGGGQRRALALVDAPRRAVEAVGVAPDQEDRRAQAALPGGPEQVGQVVPWVRPAQRGGQPARPAAAGDAGQSPGRPPPQAVDVVGQGDAPARGRRDAQRRPQGVEVALDRAGRPGRGPPPARRRWRPAAGGRSGRGRPRAARPSAPAGRRRSRRGRRAPARPGARAGTAA